MSVYILGVKSLSKTSTLGIAGRVTESIHTKIIKRVFDTFFGFCILQDLLKKELLSYHSISHIFIFIVKKGAE